MTVTRPWHPHHAHDSYQARCADDSNIPARGPDPWAPQRETQRDEEER